MGIMQLEVNSVFPWRLYRYGFFPLSVHITPRSPLGQIYFLFEHAELMQFLLSCGVIIFFRKNTPLEQMFIAENISCQLETSISKSCFQNIQQVWHRVDDVFIIHIHAVFHSVSGKNFFCFALLLHPVIYHRIKIFPLLAVQIVFICIEFREIIIYSRITFFHHFIGVLVNVWNFEIMQGQI